LSGTTTTPPPSHDKTHQVTNPGEHLFPGWHVTTAEIEKVRAAGLHALLARDGSQT
jgi:hypothetical protein